MDIAVLVGIYGAYPEYAKRVLGGIVEEQLPSDDSIQLHVAVSNGCRETISYLRELFDGGSLDTLFESKANINKDPMMRVLIDQVSTKYFLWIDDDSVLRPGWAAAMLSFVRRNNFFDGAGHVHSYARDDEYLKFLSKRPWFRREPRSSSVYFPTGGLFLARTAFVRQQSFPDKGMIKKQDDLLFGDCIEQVGGKLLDFSNDDQIMSRISISCGARRGSGEEGFGNGWLDVNPTTGF